MAEAFAGDAERTRDCGASDGSMTSDAQRVMNYLMTEKALQDNIVGMCKSLGILVYHTFDSRRSEPGFPDLVIAGKRGVVFAELKRQGGKLTKEQKAWGAAVQATAERGRHFYYVWRPHDWNNGDVEEVLRWLSA